VFVELSGVKGSRKPLTSANAEIRWSRGSYRVLFDAVRNYPAQPLE
jgi:hypothetical protein